MFGARLGPRLPIFVGIHMVNQSIPIIFGHDRFHLFAGHPAHTQFLPDPIGTLPPCSPTPHEALGETTIVLQTVGINRVHGCMGDRTVIAFALEFLQQFRPTVFAPSQITETDRFRDLKRIGLAQSASSMAALTARPVAMGTVPAKAFSRIFASSSAAMSERSLK